MKKILCILFCLLPVLGGKAQTLYRDQVRIEKESITRNEDNNVLSIDMDIVMQENLKLSSNHVVTLTPFLESNGRTKILPSIVVYGRKREVVNQRNNIAPSENTYSVIRRKHNKEQIINYHQQFQFEAWMRDAEMKLNIDVCGCCDLKEETSGELITRLNILPVQLQPAISYITPQAEAVKHRAIEGSAFLDFPVNQIIIRPEYRRNTVELAKIRATIDSVRNDDKTTLSSIRIHGYASPEGGYANNTRLAKGRTQALVDYVTSYYKFDNKLITSEYTSEDWEGFRKFIAASSLEKKDEILKLMDDSTLDIDKKERQIAQLAGPQTYKYILEECYPALRHSDYTVNYTDSEGNERERSGGGVAFEPDGTERALTEEELFEHLNEPEVEEREDGTVMVYYLDQKLDVTDKFDEDGVCYVQLEGGEKTIYMTIKRGNGYATSTTKYILPNEFNN